MRLTCSGFRTQGFTLMEVIVAMTILAVVVTILAGVFVTNADIFGFIVSSGDDLSELRLASSRITLELRSIRDKRSILRATETGIVFVDSDGEQVDLRYDAGSSEVSLNGRKLASDMSTFRLVYYDSYGKALASPRAQPETDIWSVMIEMGRAGQNNLKILSRVYPRNFI